MSEPDSLAVDTKDPPRVQLGQRYYREVLQYTDALKEAQRDPESIGLARRYQVTCIRAYLKHIGQRVPRGAPLRVGGFVVREPWR